MAAKRHVIVGGGTAGLNAMTTIREYDKGESEVVLVSRRVALLSNGAAVLPWAHHLRVPRLHSHRAAPGKLWVSSLPRPTPRPRPRQPLGPPPAEPSGDLIAQFIPRRAASLDTQLTTSLPWRTASPSATTTCSSRQAQRLPVLRYPAQTATTSTTCGRWTTPGAFSPISRRAWTWRWWAQASSASPSLTPC